MQGQNAIYPFGSNSSDEIFVSDTFELGADEEVEFELVDELTFVTVFLLMPCAIIPESSKQIKER